MGAPWSTSLRLRRKARLKEKKRKLFSLLGNKCAQCGSEKDLSVDHIDRREWGVPARAVCQETRINLYLLELESGVKLRCLCKRCNSGYLNYRRRPDE